MIDNTYIIAFKTILRKEITRFTRIWIQTLLPPMITMTLYFVIFGRFIGQRVGLMDGHTYVQYIAPGLIMMAVITNSYANVASSFFSAKFQCSIEEMLVSPIPNQIILWGYVLGGTLRGIITGFLVALVAFHFTNINVQHWFVMLVALFCTAVLFSMAGLINAMLSKKFDDISIIPTFVLTPLIYLGGVFYAVNLLHGFWYNVTLLNPIVYMVNTFRYGFLGVSDVNITLSIIMMLAFTLIFYGIASLMFRRGIGIRL